MVLCMKMARRFLVHEIPPPCAFTIKGRRGRGLFSFNAKNGKPSDTHISILADVIRLRFPISFLTIVLKARIHNTMEHNLLSNGSLYDVHVI